MSSRCLYAVRLGCLLALAAPGPAYAQTAAESSAAQARLTVGPFALSPRFSLRDVGVDSNVFNEESNPRRDFTMTAGPGLDTWLRIGRLWVTSNSTVEWVYFSEATTQRAFNVGQDVRLDLDLLRVVPHVGGGYARSRRRLNLEIDGRLEETVTYAEAGVELKPGPRTVIDLRGRRQRIRYGDEVFGGVSLASRLDRESDSASLDVRYELTPLTTFVVQTGMQQDRFAFDPVRDSDALRVLPGFEFEPFALISGKAMVGFERFETRDATVPDFRGVVAEVDVAYTVRDAFQFTVRATRDVEYSIELLEPFYVSTGAEIEIVRVIGLSWDVVGRAGRTALAYQAVENGLLAGRADRTDRVDQYGVGLGRHLGEDLRVGIDVTYAERRSDLPGRSYSGWRTGGSLTYGF